MRRGLCPFALGIGYSFGGIRETNIHEQRGDDECFAVVISDYMNERIFLLGGKRNYALDIVKRHLESANVEIDS